MMWSCPSSWLLLGLVDHHGREEEDRTSSHLGTQPRTRWSICCMSWPNSYTETAPSESHNMYVSLYVPTGSF
jgi:hypothetical protein